MNSADEKVEEMCEAVQTHKISTFPLDVQAAYYLTVQHVAEMLRQAEVPVKALEQEGSYSFADPGNGMVIIKVVPWDTRMNGLPEVEPPSHWGVSVWLRNELLSAQNMQALYGVMEGFYCPAPPNPVFCAAPNYEKGFQVIRFCMDDGWIQFNSLPGADIEMIPEELHFVAEAFADAYFPFEAWTWDVLAEVLRDIGNRVQASE